MHLKLRGFNVNVHFKYLYRHFALFYLRWKIFLLDFEEVFVIFLIAFLSFYIPKEVNCNFLIVWVVRMKHCKLGVKMKKIFVLFPTFLIEVKFQRECKTHIITTKSTRIAEEMVEISTTDSPACREFTL
jgi:hypothetical protein